MVPTHKAHKPEVFKLCISEPNKSQRLQHVC